MRLRRRGGQQLDDALDELFPVANLGGDKGGHAHGVPAFQVLVGKAPHEAEAGVVAHHPALGGDGDDAVGGGFERGLQHGERGGELGLGAFALGVFVPQGLGAFVHAVFQIPVRHAQGPEGVAEHEGEEHDQGVKEGLVFRGAPEGAGKVLFVDAGEAFDAGVDGEGEQAPGERVEFAFALEQGVRVARQAGGEGGFRVPGVARGPGEEGRGGDEVRVGRGVGTRALGEQDAGELADEAIQLALRLPGGAEAAGQLIDGGGKIPARVGEDGVQRLEALEPLPAGLQEGGQLAGGESELGADGGADEAGRGEIVGDEPGHLVLVGLKPVVVFEQGETGAQEVLVEGGIEVLEAPEGGLETLVLVLAVAFSLKVENRQHGEEQQSDEGGAFHGAPPSSSPVRVWRNRTMSARSPGGRGRPS